MAPLSGFTPYTEAPADPPWHQSTRAKVFAITFCLTLLIGVAWTLLQPTIFRSSATVLMSAPSAIDASAEEANIQSVAIQRRILLGSEVTHRLLSELTADTYDALDTQYLRDVLQVNPVADTNLVEMVAQGPDGEILPVLVDTWIEVYLEIRAIDIQQKQQQTLAVVEDQLTGLAEKVAAARESLAQYRMDNDITSTDGEENEALSRLEGLNSALNKAVEAEIAAKSDLDTLKDAIQSGKKVVPKSERVSVDKMYSELVQLQATLKNLTKNYTLDYIKKQPKWRDIPDRIAELEEVLAKELESGQELLLANAQRGHAAALQRVAGLQKRFEAQEKDAAQFTTIYTTHQALAEDLAELETLYRETQTRLAQVQVNQVEKYPQVSIIDRPADRSERVGPDHRLWLGGSLASAFAMGILSVWLYGFLGPRRAQPAVVTLSGVHMYPQDAQSQLAWAAQENARIEDAGTPLIANNAEEEVADERLLDKQLDQPDNNEEPLDKNPQ